MDAAEILTKKGYKIAVHHIETIKPFRIDSGMKEVSKLRELG